MSPTILSSVPPARLCQQSAFRLLPLSNYVCCFIVPLLVFASCQFAISDRVATNNKLRREIPFALLFAQLAEGQVCGLAYSSNDPRFGLPRLTNRSPDRVAVLGHTLCIVEEHGFRRRTLGMTEGTDI